MADVKNIITFGIGAGPGSISFFVLTGLDTFPLPGYIDLEVSAQPSPGGLLTAQPLPGRNLKTQVSPSEGLEIA